MSCRHVFPKRALACLAFALIALIPGVCTYAHEGPPFPLVLDKPLADSRISIWADPDIGEARFYIIVETADGEMPTSVPNVSIWTEPVDGRLERQTYPALQNSLRNRLQFEANPYFDCRDFWKIGVQISKPGTGVLEFATEVESTQPGLGPWDFLIYVFPFLLLGGMWAIAIARHRRNAHGQVARQSLPEAALRPSSPIE